MRSGWVVNWDPPGTKIPGMVAALEGVAAAAGEEEVAVETDSATTGVALAGPRSSTHSRMGARVEATASARACSPPSADFPDPAADSPTAGAAADAVATPVLETGT